MRRSLLGVVGSLALLLASPAIGQDLDRPLPELHAFVEDVRRGLQSDWLLMDSYTFTEEHVEKRLDGKGRVKKTKAETYEVYPSSQPGHVYRRLVTRGGERLSEEKLADQDRRHEAKVARRDAKRAAAGEAARMRKKEEAKRKEQAIIEELFRMDEIVLAGRELVNGRPAILVTFRPRPGYRPVTEGGKVLQKITGRAWIDEEEMQLVRIEAELLDGLGVGPARAIRLQKGARAYFERRKVNDEVWLPAEARFTGGAKVLLLFGGRVDVQSAYSDYRKFQIGTSEEISPAPASH